MYHIGGERGRSTARCATRSCRPLKRPIERIRHPGAATHVSEELWALKDVDLEVKHGEALGIIGRNGAGKSTLLKVLTHITEPTEGRVEITGRVASLLEVGTGFHPELTGRENIQLNGAILGMTRAEIKSKFDEIVEFSEIGRFLDTPVKRYSSGMYVRLAFAVAAHLDPEILIVDEVLAVGDAELSEEVPGQDGRRRKPGPHGPLRQPQHARDPQPLRQSDRAGGRPDLQFGRSGKGRRGLSGTPGRQRGLGHMAFGARAGRQ